MSEQTPPTEEPEVEGHVRAAGPEDPAFKARSGEPEGPEVEGHLKAGAPEDPSAKARPRSSAGRISKHARSRRHAAVRKSAWRGSRGRRHAAAPRRAVSRRQPISVNALPRRP